MTLHEQVAEARKRGRRPLPGGGTGGESRTPPPPGVPDDAPRYVRACAAGSYSLLLRDPRTGRVRVAPYRCRSWRHAGDCARARAARDYRRILDALTARRPQDLVFLVITLPRPRTGGDPVEAYHHLQRAWPRFRKRLARRWGLRGYVATLEVTKAGWPHLNIIADCPGLARRCYVRRRHGLALARGDKEVLEAELVAAGFGPVSFCERPLRRARLAGYVTKLAKAVPVHAYGRTVAEATKQSQLPLCLPRGTRRLRQSRGFLARPHRSGLEGMLVRRSPADVRYAADMAGGLHVIWEIAPSLGWVPHGRGGRAPPDQPDG